MLVTQYVSCQGSRYFRWSSSRLPFQGSEESTMYSCQCRHVLLALHLDCLGEKLRGNERAPASAGPDYYPAPPLNNNFITCTMPFE